jgi:tetratricopeptide (TPR) repeat protein
MTEDYLPNASNETREIEKTKARVNKKLIFILVGVLIAGGAAVGVSKIQEASEFNSLVSKIDALLVEDDLEKAQSELNVSEEFYGEKEDFKLLVARVNELVKSNDDFRTAEDYFSDGRYVDAISYYERVKESDKARIDKSTTKIEEATKLAVAAAISKARDLLVKKSYVNALSTLSEVNSLAGNSEEFRSLKDEISPLAADQVKREEAARNAKYVSALRGMRVQKDKFNEITFYTDRTTPYYADNSKFYLYIGKRAGSEPYLRMEVRYSDDDWLFVDRAEIKVDGSVYDFELSSSDWDRDNGSGDIWEWADVPATEYHLTIIDKVINSKSAVIRFTGSQYYDDRSISSTQKRAFVNVLNAYEALKKGLG